MRNIKRSKLSPGTRQGDILKGCAAGLIGGLAATVVMTQVQNLWNKLSQEGSGTIGGKEGNQGGRAQHRQQERAQRDGSREQQDEPATVKTAEAVSETVFDHELTKSEKQVSGQAVHYGFGTTMGVLYGVAAELAPVTTLGAGLGYGAALFLSADEVMVPALDLAKSPTEVSFSKHAYGLASHLVYGLTLDLVRRGVRRRL